MRKVLLLDFDHTLYPPNVDTLRAVDARITLFIETFLGFTHAEADALRLKLWRQYGTTLKGLEVHHGVDRDHYCDFIHAIEAAYLPPPDPALRAWLARLTHPFYIFTNARRDWAERGLINMGLAGILPESGSGTVTDELPEGSVPSARLRDILDIVFMEWEGKPNPQAYAKADRYLRSRHGEDIRIFFADDRADNLLEARRRDWSTIWIAPEEARDETWTKEFDSVVSSLTWLDPERLV